MGKPSRKRVLKDNEAKAIARNLRVSPRKLDLVAGLIRGKKVAAALADLTFSKKRIAKDVKKCLDSAIANAENNHQLDVDNLVVSEAYIGKALTMHRFTARGRGRSSPISCARSTVSAAIRWSISSSSRVMAAPGPRREWSRF